MHPNHVLDLTACALPWRQLKGQSGCYVFSDQDSGEILYVGKAINLLHRLQQQVFTKFGIMRRQRRLSVSAYFTAEPAALEKGLIIGLRPTLNRQNAR